MRINEDGWMDDNSGISSVLLMYSGRYQPDKNGVRENWDLKPVVGEKLEKKAIKLNTKFFVAPTYVTQDKQAVLKQHSADRLEIQISSPSTRGWGCLHPPSTLQHTR